MAGKTTRDSEGQALPGVNCRATVVSNPVDSDPPGALEPEVVSDDIGQFGPQLSPAPSTPPSGVSSSERRRRDPDATAVAQLYPGEAIGQYEIIRRIGAGGMGAVYLARDNKLGRRVAIKVLQARHPELTSRFITEARATARCTHENIVVIHEVGEYRGDPFMVLEYIEGQPLANFRGTKPMAVSRAVDIMVSVVRALVRAHEEGIVHRDLKPENVLISNTGLVKVLDFGIAKLREAEPFEARRQQREQRTSSINLSPSFAANPAEQSSIVGTPPYMSPEQRGVGGEIDHRTDIWAVGITLFELLSGHHPFDNGTETVTRLDIPTPSLAVEAPSVPAQLAAVVDRCLRKHKEERFPDARELLKALEPFAPGGRLQAGPVRVETGPYAGLRAFQEEDAGRFFGRSQELAALQVRIRGTALLTVIGPSGVGKSSLLRAGLVPGLRASGEVWEVLVFRPGRYPMVTLANLCAPLLAGDTSMTPDMATEAALRTRLINEPGYLGAVLRNYCRRRQTRLLVMVDQFEELYTLGAHQLERRSFTNGLAGAADDPTSPVRVVLSMRSDFLGRVAEDRHFTDELTKGLFFLGPPSKAGLREALVQPAEMVGYRFENERIVDEMVHFLEATPNGLPLLQFAAAQLWETRDPLLHLLTEQSYRGMGGVAGALVTHADKVYARLQNDLQVLCRRMMVHLVTPERTRAVRTLQELSDLTGEQEKLQQLVDKLVDSRLLVVQTSDGAATVELVHESLVVNWPTMRRWLDETQEDTAFLEQLLAAARQWDHSRRAQGLLWRGELVDELERFRRRYSGNLPDVALAFADAAKALALRGQRLRRLLLVGGAATTLMLLASAAVTIVVINDAREKADASALAARESKAAALADMDKRLRAEKAARAQEAARLEESKRRETAEGQVREIDAELIRRNVQLRQALASERSQRTIAEAAEERAKGKEREAREAERNAKMLADKLTQTVREKQARVDQLRQQIGDLIPELKEHGGSPKGIEQAEPETGGEPPIGRSRAAAPPAPPR